MAKRKAQPAAKAATFATYTVSYPGGLNLRAGPGKNFPVVRVLQPGTAVKAEGEAQGDWLPVEGGWVDQKYLEKNKEV